MRLRSVVVIPLLGVLSFLPSLLLTWPAASLATVKSTTARVPQRVVNSEGMSRGMKPPESLRLNMEGRDIVTIYATGEVQLADGLTVDEASREFWRKVGALAPTFCRERGEQAQRTN